VAGNQALFERMQAVVLAKCVRGHEGSTFARGFTIRKRVITSSGTRRSCRSPTSRTAAAGCATSRTCLDGILQVPGAVVG